MNRNIGTPDRLVRFAIGVICLGLGFSGKSGFMVLGGLFAFYEAFSSWCLFYQLIGRNTCQLHSSDAKAQEMSIVRVFLVGVGVLLAAIMFNAIAMLIGWKTWYGFLAEPSLQLSTDNYLFLFIVYPLGLGTVATQLKKLLIR